MKKYFLLLQTLMLCFAFTACSDDDDVAPTPPEPETPTVTLTAGTAEAAKLTFTIKTIKAERCAWMYQQADSGVPTADDVLSRGTAVDVKNTEPVEITDLLPETDYEIYAAVEGKGGKVLSEVLKMRTEKAEGPAFVEANILVEATYRTDNPAGAGEYGITLSNAELGADGEPQNVGDFFLSFSLFNKADEDVLNAAIPAGEYKPAANFEPFTWNPTDGIFMIRTESQMAAVPLTDGNIKVTHDKNSYVIEITAMLFTGENLAVRYTGDIQFVQTGTSDNRFTRPQNVTFEKTEKNFYYGNWFRALCDDLNIHFYTGTMDEKGHQIDGYYLSLPVFMAKEKDPFSPDIRLQEGVYTISPRDLTQLNSIPMILQKGALLDFMGEQLLTGTHLTYINGNNGRKEVGICTKGTMTVKHVGANYKIDFDFETEEGISITGVYEGELPLTNKCDNDKTQPERPWSKVTEDRKLNIPADAQADLYMMGDYLVPGLKSCFLTIVPKENNADMFTTEFFIKGDTFEPGTYTIANTLEANYALPGWLTREGKVLYSWYGDMSSVDAEGYANILGPLTEGTFTVSKEGENYKFVFDMKDDAQHKFTGEWTGKMNISDATQQPTAVKEKFTRRIQGRR